MKLPQKLKKYKVKVKEQKYKKILSLKLNQKTVPKLTNLDKKIKIKI